MRDGAHPLHEEEMQHYRSMVGTALYVEQDIPEAQYATKESASEVYDQTTLQVSQRGVRAQLDSPQSGNAERGQSCHGRKRLVVILP